MNKMPRTAKTGKSPAKTLVKRKTRSTKAATVGTPAKTLKKSHVQKPPIVVPDLPNQEESAYERLLKKVQDNRARRGETSAFKDADKGRKMGRSVQATEKVVFQEDENVVELEVSKVTERMEFPTPSEDEEDMNNSDGTEEGELVKSLKNSNVTVAGQDKSLLLGATRLSGAKQLSYLEEERTTLDGRKSNASSLNLGATLVLMQNFMVKKGLLDTSMSAEEIEQFIQEGVDFPLEGVAAATEFQRLSDTNKTVEPVKCKETDKGNVPMATTLGSPSTSEVTIYKRAVQQIAPDLEEQIDRFVTDTRKSLIPLMPPELPAKDIGRKELSSSDELMDTSDETEDANMFLFTGPDATKKIKTPGEKADDYIRDAEHSHARMMEVEGKELTQADNSFNVSLIDNDYQMIDAHLDESIRKKIWNYEFIDFGELLVRGVQAGTMSTDLSLLLKMDKLFLHPWVTVTALISHLMLNGNKHSGFLVTF